jgi:hypothetical protein
MTVRTKSQYSNGWKAMAMNSCELSADELSGVVGGGIVDSVLPEAEAAADLLVKQAAESGKKFMTFLTTPAAELPTPMNVG